MLGLTSLSAWADEIGSDTTLFLQALSNYAELDRRTSDGAEASRLLREKFESQRPRILAAKSHTQRANFLRQLIKYLGPNYGADVHRYAAEGIGLLLHYNEVPRKVSRRQLMELRTEAEDRLRELRWQALHHPGRISRDQEKLAEAIEFNLSNRMKIKQIDPVDLTAEEPVRAEEKIGRNAESYLQALRKLVEGGHGISKARELIEQKLNQSKVSPFDMDEPEAIRYLGEFGEILKTAPNDEIRRFAAEGIGLSLLKRLATEEMKPVKREAVRLMREARAEALSGKSTSGREALVGSIEKNLKNRMGTPDVELPGQRAKILSGQELLGMVNEVDSAVRVGDIQAAERHQNALDDLFGGESPSVRLAENENPHNLLDELTETLSKGAFEAREAAGKAYGAIVGAVQNSETPFNSEQRRDRRNELERLIEEGIPGIHRVPEEALKSVREALLAVAAAQRRTQEAGIINSLHSNELNRASDALGASLEAGKQATGELESFVENGWSRFQGAIKAAIKGLGYTPRDEIVRRTPEEARRPDKPEVLKPLDEIFEMLNPVQLRDPDFANDPQLKAEGDAIRTEGLRALGEYAYNPEAILNGSHEGKIDRTRLELLEEIMRKGTDSQKQLLVEVLNSFIPGESEAAQSKMVPAWLRDADDLKGAIVDHVIENEMAQLEGKKRPGVELLLKPIYGPKDEPRGMDETIHAFKKALFSPKAKIRSRAADALLALNPASRAKGYKLRPWVTDPSLIQDMILSTTQGDTEQLARIKELLVNRIRSNRLGDPAIKGLVEIVSNRDNPRDARATALQLLIERSENSFPENIWGSTVRSLHTLLDPSVNEPEEFRRATALLFSRHPRRRIKDRAALDTLIKSIHANVAPRILAQDLGDDRRKLMDKMAQQYGRVEATDNYDPVLAHLGVRALLNSVDRADLLPAPHDKVQQALEMLHGANIPDEMNAFHNPVGKARGGIRYAIANNAAAEDTVPEFDRAVGTNIIKSDPRAAIKTLCGGSFEQLID